MDLGDRLPLLPSPPCPRAGEGCAGQGRETRAESTCRLIGSEARAAQMCAASLAFFRQGNQGQACERDPVLLKALSWYVDALRVFSICDLGQQLNWALRAEFVYTCFPPGKALEGKVDSVAENG